MSTLKEPLYNDYCVALTISPGFICCMGLQTAAIDYDQSPNKVDHGLVIMKAS